MTQGVSCNLRQVRMTWRDLLALTPSPEAKGASCPKRPILREVLG
jgi:hypothetical protein